MVYEKVTLVPEVYFSSPLRNENNKNKPLEPGYEKVDNLKISWGPRANGMYTTPNS
jgi:hypothetical protein